MIKILLYKRHTELECLPSTLKIGTRHFVSHNGFLSSVSVGILVSSLVMCCC